MASIPKDEPHDHRDRRIFVQMPAYRDPELGPTLTDLFAKAARPADLRVAVLWQKALDDTLEPALLRRPNLELIEIPFSQSKGCNWARHELQKRWGGEPYTLILDSHHRFRRGWDSALLEAHDHLVAAGIEKPIVTAYLPAYDPLTDPKGRKSKPLRLYPYDRAEGMLLRLIGRPILNWTSLDRPVPGDFVSLHCLFAAGGFNTEVRFDPECYFFGDEVSTSLRAFTSGYDIFHPHRVIGWHCYDRRHRTVHWADHADWSSRETHSKARMRKLLTGGEVAGYGRGNRRSLADYEERLAHQLVLSEVP